MKGFLKKFVLSFLGGDGLNPFSIMGSLWPANEAGKYVIESEGIRLAFVKTGGALANLWINDTNCREIDVVLGFDNGTQYEKYDSEPGCTLNCAIGRYAGIIGGGNFDLDGITYQTSKNSKDGKSTVHGGAKSWGKMQLYPAGHTKNSITFVVFDRDRGSRNGFPGGAAASLTHTLTPYEWKISYGVTPIGAAFPISLSQQVFWNLDGLREGERTVAQHTLALPYSGLRLDRDDLGVPSGDICGNKANSSLDFWSRPRSIGPLALDDTFLINRRQPWSMYTSPVASLSSDKSGVKMELYTDQEALHVTTWDKDDGAIQLKKSQLTENSQGRASPVPRHAAISLQMQDWTDAINHPEWQREDRVVWGTDRLYTMYSTYKFSVKRGVDRCN